MHACVTLYELLAFLSFGKKWPSLIDTLASPKLVVFGANRVASVMSQVYGRSAWYNGVWAIMYSWYFPKDSPVSHFGHRHDWKHVIVWIDNPTNFPGKILAMAPSAHSGYSTYVPPDADMVGGTRVKVEYTSSIISWKARQLPENFRPW